MAVEITGQRWKVLAYADVVAAVPQDGEMYVLSGVTNFEAPRVAVIGDGSSTVAQLVAMRQTRPIYAYGDVDTDIPEAGAQVALIEAPGTTLYVVVVTGDGTHTINDLVVNFNANLESIANAAADDAIAEALAPSAGVVEVDADYTVQSGDRVLKIVDVAEIDITIPDTLPINTSLVFIRVVASANKVTALRSGADDLIEGGTSFVVMGAKAADEFDPSEVTLRKVASNDWRFVCGVIRGENSNGVWSISANGQQETEGSITPPSNSNTGTTYTFPRAFKSGTTPKVWQSATGIISGTTEGSYVTEHNDVTDSTVKVKVLGHGASTISNPTTVPINVCAKGVWR